jgi:hypothetical protein
LARWRYRWLARCIGLSAARGLDRKPGVVFCQIDGLGYEQLREALAAGYLPFVRALIQREGYRLERWRCGVPADTPPVQGALLYGRSDGVPGFYWMEKATGRRLSCLNPLHASEVETRLNGHGGGLLAEGSSYANIFTGGARRTLFTTSALFSEPLPTSRHLLAMLVFLRPARVLQVVTDILAELFAEARDFVESILTARLRRSIGPFPIARIVVNVAMRELATTATRLDMVLGVPAIYVNFVGYDLVGHQSGARSASVLATLGGIDRAIRRIAETREFSARPYRVVLLSDHGLTPSIPFELVFGQSFASFVAALAARCGARARIRVHELDEHGYLFRAVPYLRLARLHLRELRPMAYRMRVRLLMWIGRRLNGGPDQEAGAPISVTVGGSLAHIYLRESAERLSLEAVEQVRPGLIANLLAHPGVGVVVGRSRGKPVALGRGGRTLLANPRVIEGADPLAEYDEPDVAAEQLRRFAERDNRGDLIVLGAYRDGRVVAFETQLACHGGLGGGQSYPFLLLPAEHAQPLDTVLEAADLHPFLQALVPRGASVEEASLPRPPVAA